MTLARSASARAVSSGRSPAASVAQGAMALLTVQPLTWAASLLTAVLVPRYLGDAGLGAYALALTIAGFAGTVASLGVPGYLVRRVASAPGQANTDAGAALVLLTGMAALVAAALGLGLPLIGFPTAQVDILRLALVAMIALTVQGVFNSLLIGQERHGRFASLNAGVALATACAGVGVLIAGGGATGYIAAGAAAAILMAFVGWRLSGFRLHHSARDVRLWRRLTRGGAPFLGRQLALQVYGSCDWILLGLLSRDAVIGWYVAAYRITSIPLFIPTLIATPLLPALSRHVDDRPAFQQTLQRSVAAVLVFSIPIAAMIIALAPAIPGLLGWPSGFRHSVPLMIILALHQPFVAVDILLGNALIALHRERRWFHIALLAAVFNPALNLALIPAFERTVGNGAIGAALVTLATELLIFAGALILLPSRLIGRETASVAARIVLAAASLALVTTALRSVLLPLAVVAGGAAFAGVALALGVVRASDLRQACVLARTCLPRRATHADT